MNSKAPQGSENNSRVYAKPELRKYGHLAQITSNVGPKGADDGGGGAAAGPKTGV